MQEIKNSRKEVSRDSFLVVSIWAPEPCIIPTMMFRTKDRYKKFVILKAIDGLFKGIPHAHPCSTQTGRLIFCIILLCFSNFFSYLTGILLVDLWFLILFLWNCVVSVCISVCACLCVYVFSYFNKYMCFSYFDAFVLFYFSVYFLKTQKEGVE